MENTIRIKDGFKHQKLIIIPNHIINTLSYNPITKGLYPIYLGYFPHAKNHYISRPEGAPHHILIVNIDGIGTISLPNTEVPLSSNQMYIIPKNTAHEYKADKKNPWSIYWIHFDGEIIEEICALFSKNKEAITIDYLNRSIITQYFNEMISLLEMGYAPDHLYHVSSLFRSLMTRAHHTSFIHQNIATTAKDYTLEAMHFMQSNIHQQLTLASIAKHSGISKNHLMVVFKEKTGTSPIDYFIHMKIQKACELLGTTDFTIKHIALLLGYNDPYYFSRLFKRVMTLSPKAYRSQNIT